MNRIGTRRWGFALSLIGITLTGCHAEYHGYDSGIDGTLWRQIASFEDPLSRELYEPSAHEPIGYLGSLLGQHWDGSRASAPGLTLGDGGVVLYDIASSRSVAELSVFITSGPRPSVPTDSGGFYAGPSQVFTCYRIEAKFSPIDAPSVNRVTFKKCPAPLVELVPEDAAFASGEVFDG